MKILWLTIDRSSRVAQHFDAFQNAASRLTDVICIRQSTEGLEAGQFSRQAMSGNIRRKQTMLSYLRSSKEEFDFVFTDALFGFINDGWDEIRCPKGVLLEDLHGPIVKWQVEMIKEFNFDVVFHRYKLPLQTFHPTICKGHKCFWLPHAVDMDVFKDYGLGKSIEVLHTGVASPVYYPMRQQIIRYLQGKSYFYTVDRPSEDPSKRGSNSYRGRQYAKLLSSSKICTTTGSKLHYPVLKYFEIPACNTLLIGDWFPELRILGFDPQENMVCLDVRNIAEQVEWWLAHDKERERIVLNGMEFIHKYHSMEVRAKQFLNEICKVIGRDPMFEIKHDFHVSFITKFTNHLLGTISDLNIEESQGRQL